MIIPTKKATKEEIKKLPGPILLAWPKKRLPLKGGVKTHVIVCHQRIESSPIYAMDRDTQIPDWAIVWAIVLKILKVANVAHVAKVTKVALNKGYLRLQKGSV